MSSLPPPNSTASSSTGDFVNVTMDEVPLSTPQQPEPSAAAGEIEAQPEQQQQPGGQQHHAPGAAVAAAPAQAEGSGGLLGLWGGTTAAAAGSRAGGSPAGAAEHDPLREIEEAAAKVADQARQAADQARHAAKAASAKLREGATELAANLSSWWAALEPGNQFSLGAGASAQSRHQDYSAIQLRLGLDAGEAILESFKCQLLQAYTCTNNPFTPDRQVPFPGELHITSSRVCFVFEGGERETEPVKVDHKAVLRVTKEKAEGGLPERLVLALSEDGKQNLVLTHFTLKELEMDSALALLEHLASE